MREFPDLQWHLIPGNHDADQPEGVWARLVRSGLPANVQIHREPGPVLIDPAQNGWLLPAVLKRRHVLTDLTAIWMRPKPRRMPCALVWPTARLSGLGGE
nr:hypothetical protein [Acetobacter persici]